MVRGFRSGIAGAGDGARTAHTDALRMLRSRAHGAAPVLGTIGAIPDG